MRKGSAQLGTRAELKNINSFRFVQKAIDHEIARQVEVIESGGAVVQETRLYDPQRDETRSMRGKEEAHDYRYFPEPDLPPVVVTAERLRALSETLPELPDARRARFISALSLPVYDAAQLTVSRATADFFEATVATGVAPKAASNWMMGELARALNAAGKDISASPVSPPRLGELIALVEQGTISGAAAKQVFDRMFDTGRPAAEIVREEGLTQIDDDASLLTAVDEVLGRHQDAVTQYRSGKSGALGFLVGQVMKATGGKANPRRVNDLLKRALESQGAA
jgi:aspartyl-tRNA(Asn)/glutamyl-tRNA(Gln) amidotransferase subunit B